MRRGRVDADQAADVALVHRNPRLLLRLLLLLLWRRSGSRRAAWGLIVQIVQIKRQRLRIVKGNDAWRRSARGLLLLLLLLRRRSKALRAELIRAHNDELTIRSERPIDHHAISAQRE